MVGCLAFGCTNSTSKKDHHVSFHCFPRDREMIERWLEAIKRKTFKPTQHSRICSEHFEDECFVKTFGRKTLASDAVPTKFNFAEQTSKRKSLQLEDRIKEEPITIVEEQLRVEEVMIKEEPIVKEECMEEPPEMASAPSPTSSINGTAPPLQVVKPSIINKKCKRSVPVYMGDISNEDFYNPARMKVMWDIAKKTVERQRKTLRYLQQRNRVQTRKIQSLNEAVSQLKQKKC